MDKLIKKLKEKSTWKGVLYVAAATVGFSLAPEFKTQLIALLVAGVGVIEMIAKGKAKEEDK